MNGLVVLYLSTMGLGLAFCAPPGVVNAESVRRGLQGGFRPALMVQLGSLIGDAFWAILAFSGLALLVGAAPVRLVLGLVGTAFLLHLAWSALHAALVSGAAPAVAGGKGVLDDALKGAFVRGATFSLTNPFALAFWLGAGGGIAALAPDGAGHGVMLLIAFAGFMSGAVVWCIGLAALLAWGRGLVGPTLFRWIDGLCGLAFGYYAVHLGVETLRTVLAR